MVKSVPSITYLASLIGINLSLLAGLTLPVLAQSAQPASPPASDKVVTEEDTTPDPTDPNSLRPLAQGDSLLSVQGGEKLMTEAEAAINGGQYNVAIEKLQQARRVFNQLSNFHLQLANSFSGIDTVIVESQRGGALKNGQRRDEATYQLALVHRAQNQPELAVPLLIQIIRSQNPTTELGRKSYQQLYELGFADQPFGAPPSAPGSATAPATSSSAPK
jgi:hypothetical protein